MKIIQGQILRLLGLCSVCYTERRARGMSSSLSTSLGTKFEKAQLFQKANGMSERRYQKERINAENPNYKRRMWKETVAGQSFS